jgi:CDP-4-dehydro-6-deoxyglucose reductase, E3
LTRAGATLREVLRPNAEIHQLRLHVDAGWSFLAGQYLNVLHPSGIAIPFSIASAPERLPELEIDFRPMAGSREADAMLELLAPQTQNQARIGLEGPFGRVTQHGPTRGALRLIAGGTGIGQCRAIVEHLTHCPQRSTVTLVWSARSEAALYDLARLERFAQAHSWLTVATRLDAPDGRSRAILDIETHGAPSEDDIVIAGTPGFVYAVVDAIAAAGGDVSRLRSDVFDYSKRP